MPVYQVIIFLPDFAFLSDFFCYFAVQAVCRQRVKKMTL